MYSQNNLYIPEGEQFNTYAAPGGDASTGSGGQRWPLGTKACAQDGRGYRFARAGGATLLTGDLLQAAANAASDVNVTAIAAAVAARSLGAITTNPTVINRYAEGYVNVSVTPGAGQSFLINDHAAGTTAAITFNFAAGHSIRVALTTTSRLDFIANPYKSVIEVPVTTGTAAKVGVAISGPTTTQHCWIQTKGIASIFTSGTLVLGCPAAYIQVARAVGPIAAVATDFPVGSVQRVSAGSAWSDILLNLD